MIILRTIAHPETRANSNYSHTNIYCSWPNTSNVCIDANTLDQLPEDGNLAQLRVIAIDSPTMDSPTSYVL